MRFVHAFAGSFGKGEEGNTLVYSSFFCPYAVSGRDHSIYMMRLFSKLSPNGCIDQLFAGNKWNL